ncbi:MAG: hypothetical protein WD794_04095 [Mycobacteriales bacterium]
MQRCLLAAAVDLGLVEHVVPRRLSFGDVLDTAEAADMRRVVSVTWSTPSSVWQRALAQRSHPSHWWMFHGPE